MARYGMIIDVERCTGCYSCTLACKDEFTGNDYPPLSAAQTDNAHSWIRVSEHERGTFPKVKVTYLPLPCVQCEEAACIKAVEGAVYRREDGIVVIDPVNARGQKSIVESCPHGVITWNAKRNIPQKCTFCAHLLDQGWPAPRCVEACPVNALVFGDLNDRDSAVSRRLVSEETLELHPEYGLKPRVRFTGLPTRFIVGEVVLGDKADSCAEGVVVTLSDGEKKRSVYSDNYGDFEFDGLDAGRDYTLRLEQEGYIKQEMVVYTDTDINLGTIYLSSGR